MSPHNGYIEISFRYIGKIEVTGGIWSRFSANGPLRAHFTNIVPISLKIVELSTFCLLRCVQFQTPVFQLQSHQNTSLNTSSTKQHFFETHKFVSAKLSTTQSGPDFTKGDMRFALPLKCIPLYQLYVHRLTASQTRTNRFTVVLGQSGSV